MEVAERLRQAIERTTFRFEGQVVPVTASFGVATYPDTTSRWEGLFQLADRALYQAKREGRNRVRSIAASADAAAS
jgi:diguanylate cyclase (GGDEF)-like protein